VIIPWHTPDKYACSTVSSPHGGSTSWCRAACLVHHRLIVQVLPLLLVGGVAVIVAATRVVQLLQTQILRTLPFGSLAQFSLWDVCVGVVVSGLFMMYFGALPLCACKRLLCSRTGIIISYVILRPCGCAVVVKSSLMPFDCVPLGATHVLDKAPTVLCDASDGPYRRMRIVASVTIVLYVLGLPAALALILARNWLKVTQDQQLRERGEGDSSLTNPNFQFRRRYRKVYEDFRPQCAYWKVVLLLRKLGLAMITVLANG
jgi:hypothetical protein